MISPPHTRSTHALLRRYADAIRACDNVSATKPYQLLATTNTMPSIAAKVPTLSCGGAADENTAAKNATDLRLARRSVEDQPSAEPYQVSGASHFHGERKPRKRREHNTDAENRATRPEEIDEHDACHHRKCFDARSGSRFMRDRNEVWTGNHDAGDIHG